MSHIVKCSVAMTNIGCLEKSITHLGLTSLGRGTHKLFGSRATGLGFKLPAWHHPVVVDTEKGEAVYDNYGGNWGKQIELDKLVQRYSAEVAQEQALASGYTYEEQILENGDIEAVMTQLVSV